MHVAAAAVVVAVVASVVAVVAVQADQRDCSLQAMVVIFDQTDWTLFESLQTVDVEVVVYFQPEEDPVEHVHHVLSEL